MSTTAMTHGPDTAVHEDARTTREARLGRVGLGTAGVIAVLASVWGGIVPYVGPLFNYSGDGTGAWHWNLAHAVLALAPGVVGALLGVLIIAESRGVTMGKRRLSLATAGTLLMVCGAWFAIGPLAWPVISSASGAYFVAASHVRLLEFELGYSIGTGLVLVVCGAFVDGWASRHRPVDREFVATREAPGTVESGI